MKKSKTIKLVLITALLASCHKEHKNNEWQNGNKVYMRSDSTAGYAYVPNNNFLLWYLAFRPYGVYYGGYYHHAGYYSAALPERSNVGTSSMKSGIVRGGFGSGGHTFSVSS